MKILFNLYNFFQFEPGLMRYNAMLVTKYDHFKTSPKTTLIGTMLVIIPFGLYGYILKTRKVSLKM